MNIDQYVEERKRELDSFASTWRQNQGDPGWPEDMEEGEWFEQEAAFGAYSDRHD